MNSGGKVLAGLVIGIIIGAGAMWWYKTYATPVAVLSPTAQQ